MSNSQNNIQYPAQLGQATQPVITLLSSLKLLRVSGEDASTFLQNMLTNDVKALANEQGQINGLCNPKGRLISVFYLVKQDSTYKLIMSADLIDFICQRLTMFKLRSNVDFLIDEIPLFGIIDNSADIVPEWSLMQKSAVSMLHIPSHDKLSRYLCFGDIADLKQEDYQVGDESIWRYLDIAAGLPMVCKPTQEQFVPQQINFEIAGGVSFKKGCYPGQEIVARMHYLGKPSRRLYTAEINTDIAADAFDEIIDESGSTIGHIVQTASLDAQTLLLQLSLKVADSEKTLFLKQQQINNVKPMVEEAES